MSYELFRALTEKDNENQTPSVMFVNGSLKKNKDESNTYYLWNEVEKEFKKQGIEKFEYFHLAKMNIQPGVNRKLSTRDDMEDIYQGLKNNDIIVFGTPIWWGNPSSLIQRVIERFDDIDTYRNEYEQIMLKKIFCSIISGYEDGGQQCVARLNGWATYLGFTISPYSGLLWLGNEKSDVKKIVSEHPSRRGLNNIHGYLVMLVENAVRCSKLIMKG